eukprot:TRINITY_DN17374_c0_g1_i1.p1 TRINITY_DN17374_c0_g1~~TRINITY_DN17374_c0_g1_i1.p1  ORF type:complete len:266 (+),score=106.23 TRINITY_DN17374_c0_g1_i1:54-800(+)
MAYDAVADAAAAIGAPHPEASDLPRPMANGDEARKAAKRLLRELSAARQRADDAEARLERAFSENEELVRLLTTRSDEWNRKEREWAAERERLLSAAPAAASAAEQTAALSAALAKERELTQHLRASVASGKAEVLRVAQKCAERLADSVTRLQQREEECQRLQAELAHSREQRARGSSRRRQDREARAERAAADASARRRDTRALAEQLSRERLLVRQLQGQLAIASADKGSMSREPWPEAFPVALS